MSTPGNSEAQSTLATTEPTYEQQVGDVVKQFTTDDSGKTILPEGLEISDSMRYAAMAEKRRRDTESALGKATQKLKAEETTNKELQKRLAGQAQFTISAEEQASLDELKFSDPEAWRRQVNALEQKATATLNEELGTISAEASRQAELDRRLDVLQQFNSAHSDAPITDAALSQDIPPRITKKLEAGKITFEEFLQESYDYLVTPKTTRTAATKATPSLGDAGGGSAPSAEAEAGEQIASYSHTIF